MSFHVSLLSISRQQFEILFLIFFFLRNRLCRFMSVCLEMICLKCRSCFVGKIDKKCIIFLSSIDFAICILRIKDGIKNVLALEAIYHLACWVKFQHITLRNIFLIFPRK